MAASVSPDSRREALAGLRAALEAGHRAASPAAFTLAAEAVVQTGFCELDAALGGGFPRGTLATLEGPAGSGRSAVAARLLAAATAGGGLAGLIESPAGGEGCPYPPPLPPGGGLAGRLGSPAGFEGSPYPPALAAAGVDLQRLLVIPAKDSSAVARA